MPVDISFDNEGSLFQGRLYRDNKYYHVFDGEKYIAVSPFTGEMYSIENPLDELNIGDTVTVDRDISFTVDKIEYDSAWEDFYSPESGTNIDGFVHYRPQGKIIVSDDYYFIHPDIEICPDGSIITDGNVDPDSWILRWDYEYEPINGFPIYMYGPCKWYRIASDCVVSYEINGEMVSGNIEDIFKMLDEGFADYPLDYYMSFFTTRDGVIIEVLIVGIE
ncbi:MAG: hypothetical protein K6A80_10185 [Saccharofermentans sp.]|nr:hypothetical protein [Saccharofermentans sp.]